MCVKLDIHDVIISPIKTEKFLKLTAISKYGFFVHKSANKTILKKAAKFLFGYTPLDVNVMNRVGKKVVFRRKRGQRPSRKIAIFTMSEGEAPPVAYE